MESLLRQIRRELELTQEDLAKVLNCSKANISMKENDKSSLTKNDKQWLVQKFNIAPMWLEGKKVAMFLPETEHGKKMRVVPTPHSNSVPVYDLKKIPGLVQLFRRKNDFKPSSHITIPHLPKCDGAINIIGDAMSPILRSGDLVLYSQLASISEIFWGDMYLLSMETSAGEYIAVRYIRKSENKGMAVLVGENPLYADTEVALSKIHALAFVKATIRMNSSK